MQHYIHLSKYSRFRDEDNRRETWDETVDRLGTFWKGRITNVSLETVIDTAIESVRNYEAMPSMRTLMTAGKALERDEAAGFNCSGIAVSHTRVFDEIFYLLMCGSGVGFSVERQYINKMPEVAEELHATPTVINVKDSKIGWAKGLKELIALLYNGDVPSWDLSRVRAAGARLRTFGGRASGPDPLNLLFHYVVGVFRGAKGRKLNSIECHDLICKIADTVIVGSVRRSACISLSNLTDDRMRRAKMGDWWNKFPHRALANNSVAYTEKPDLESFLKEFRSIYVSKAGERGIINKVALKLKAESCDREYEGDYLLNPCGEAILRDSGGLCNLSEVIIRSTDTIRDLEEKVINATVLGTLQSTLDNFRYLRKVWSDNQKEERLLGVSLTGIMDHALMSSPYGYTTVVEAGDIISNTEELAFVEKVERFTGVSTGVRGIGDIIASDILFDLEDALTYLKGVARDTNVMVARELGIEPSKQLTLVKPSGTVSQLCGTSSGIHPRFAPYYLRRVTQDIKDPLTDLMIDEGVPHVVRDQKVVFSYPVKSPEGSTCVKDMRAIDQLELWLVYKKFWCEGNPSQTIYYTDDEFLKVQSWVWDHWDEIGGLSFFPLDDNIYDAEIQPYLEITEEEYDEARSDWPKEVSYDRLVEYESTDNTTGPQTFACAGGSCDLS